MTFVVLVLVSRFFYGFLGTYRNAEHMDTV